MPSWSPRGQGSLNMPSRLSASLPSPIHSSVDHSFVLSSVLSPFSSRHFFLLPPFFSILCFLPWSLLLISSIISSAPFHSGLLFAIFLCFFLFYFPFYRRRRFVVPSSTSLPLRIFAAIHSTRCNLPSASPAPMSLASSFCFCLLPFLLVSLPPTALFSFPSSPRLCLLLFLFTSASVQFLCSCILSPFSASVQSFFL